MGEELVRYRPDDAVRWLQAGAKTIRDRAVKVGEGVFKRSGERNLKKDVFQTAGAVFDVGKSAVADLMHLSAANTEYVLSSTGFEVSKAGATRLVSYATIRRIRLSRDQVVLELEQGSITISPPAHIVAGGVRAPIGWLRNGLQVPFEVLIEEIAAHAQLRIEPE